MGTDRAFVSKAREELGSPTKTYGGARKLGKKPVVVATAIAEPIPCLVKRESGYERDRMDIIRGSCERRRVRRGLINSKGVSNEPIKPTNPMPGELPQAWDAARQGDGDAFRKERTNQRVRIDLRTKR